MEISHQTKLQHLYWRAGFGITYPELKHLHNRKIRMVVDDLLEDSDFIPTLTIETDYKPIRKKELSTKERRAFDEKTHETFQLMQQQWVDRMSSGKGRLRERMILFWHNHFACRMENPLLMVRFHNTIAQNALGNFRVMLTEISKEPAMLAFLNNRKNKKAHPNENFARELMELFTRGRGNYTESDVAEAARAFTGWTYQEDFNFFVHQKQHDDGIKTVLGKTGNLDGEDIINILLDKRETAEFISRKVYSEFVNHVPYEPHIQQMADVFYRDFDIGSLMHFIFTAEWFYNIENIGAVIKSPVALLAGINRQVGVQFKDAASCLKIQKALGQVLFFPPNVAGWPGGRSWIDSNTLMLRMRLASALLNNGEIDMIIEDEVMHDEMMAMEESKPVSVLKKIEAVPDWNGFLKDIPENIDKEELSHFLIHTGLKESAQQMLRYLKGNRIKELVVDIMSLPEYQLS